VDPEASLVRVAARNGAEAGFKETRFDDETLDFHRRVRSRFLVIAQKEPQRVAVIPAADVPDKVEDAVWAKVAPLMRVAGYPVR